jgi:hypothetical protein
MTGARRVRYRGLEKVEFAETLKALGINMFRVARYLINLGKSIDPIANFDLNIAHIALKTGIFSLLCFLRHKIRLIYEKYSMKLFFVSYIPKIV